MKWMQMSKMPPLGRNEQYPLPNRMSIETSSACNRTCSFCPQSKYRNYPQRIMRDDLYHSIITQIPSTVKCIELFRLNEPLLFKGYIDNVALLRLMHPRVTIYCATNGDVIKAQKNQVEYMVELQRAGINVMSIDMYDDDTKWAFDLCNKLVTYRMFDYTEHRYQAHPVNKMHITIAKIGQKVGGITSAWTNCDMKDIVAPTRRCPRPMRHFVVLYDGHVPLCCVINPEKDGNPIMGDMNKNTLIDIWNNEKFYKYRRALQDGDRTLAGCNNCDAKVAYAHVVRRVK